jgi:phosphatidate phosphatase APP1
MVWRKPIWGLFSGRDEKMDRVTFNLRRRLKLIKPLQIITYRSYGTPERLYLKGRLIANKGITAPVEEHSSWRNLVNMYKRFQTDEIPGAQLGVHFKDQHHTITTDEGGYFVLNLAPEEPLELDHIWHPLEVELLSSPVNFKDGLKATAEVLVPPADAEYGIISDVDDTIIETSATNLLKMSGKTLLHNAHTRVPFAGVSAFYHALLLGRNGKRNNPFFYVSSSPWNLYDMLVDFLDVQQIPAGPLLLRDFGMSRNKPTPAGHMGHKLKEIENILLTYPQLDFILIGDSGQEDPKIYREVVRRYPSRILAIYIRDVKLKRRAQLVEKLSDELKDGPVEMLLVPETVTAAKHAVQKGFILLEAIPEIEKDTQKDQASATP